MFTKDVIKLAVTNRAILTIVAAKVAYSVYVSIVSSEIQQQLRAPTAEFKWTINLCLWEKSLLQDVRQNISAAEKSIST